MANRETTIITVIKQPFGLDSQWLHVRQDMLLTATLLWLTRENDDLITDFNFEIWFYTFNKVTLTTGWLSRTLDSGCLPSASRNFIKVHNASSYNRQDVRYIIKQI